MKRSEGVFYEPLLWNISCTLLVAGLVLSILMWANVIGPFRFTALSEARAELAVGLWVPDTPERAISAETARRLAAWRAALSEDRTPIAGRSLSELVAQGVGAVVVPDARFLDASRISELRAFVRRGAGAIVVGAIGVLEPDGAWRGWGLMERALSVGEITPLEAGHPRRVVAWRRGPVSAGLMPGEEIRLSPEPGAPSIPDPETELRWVAATADRAEPVLSASHRLELGRGRLLWLAAGPERSWQAAVDPWQAMARLVDGALSWIGRQPMLEVLPGSPAASSGEPLATRKSGSSSIATRLERVGPRRLLVRLSNLGAAALVGRTLRLYLNRPVESANVAATAVFEGRPGIRYQYGAESVDLLLPDVPAGASRSYTFDYETLARAAAGAPAEQRLSGE